MWKRGEKPTPTLPSFNQSPAALYINNKFNFSEKDMLMSPSRTIGRGVGRSYFT